VWYTNVNEPPYLSTAKPVSDDALVAAGQCMAQDGVVALKGLGGFHLACRADSSYAINRLRTSKNRPAKPLAVMMRTVAEATNYCHVSPAEAALLTAPEAPIVLLRKRIDEEARQLAPEISPQNGCIGVMLPYTPLHHLLLQAAGAPLVMTSGNRRGEPLCIDNDEARVGLSPYCDGFLFHNRPIARRCDDSVMFVAQFDTQPVVQPIRRSRGLAPLPVLLPKAIALDMPLVAAGADLKNVPALAVERQVFLTQHIGDMENLKAREEHARAIADFEQFFRIQPQAVVCDLHPGYASVRYARERAASEDLPLIEVQHHHAHLAACLAENDHPGLAIGLCFDGTGYGTDGHVWGSEVLLADLQDFERCYHLQYLPLPGGDAATRKPYRIALAYVRTLLPDLGTKSLFPDVSAWELSTLDAMLTQNLNTPLTSSMGRLFDAVSALLGLCRETTYEAQAAISLEDAALKSDVTGPAYPFEFADGEIRLAELFAQLIADRRNGVFVPHIACRFHLTVAQMAVAAAQAVRAQTEAAAKRVNQVALSGGVWQNRLLLEMTVPLLRQAGFEVLLHHNVPANDGGLAYGQVAVAAAQLKSIERKMNNKE
jgi:hydrogenase maturation protein HypF